MPTEREKIESERDREGERMADAKTSITPQLVNKLCAQHAIWVYFGFKIDEQGEAVSTGAPLCKG